VAGWVAGAVERSRGPPRPGAQAAPAAHHSRSQPLLPLPRRRSKRASLDGGPLPDRHGLVPDELLPGSGAQPPAADPVLAQLPRAHAPAVLEAWEFLCRFSGLLGLQRVGAAGCATASAAAAGARAAQGTP
jgi:hypothetical protein